ncbi:MAG: GDP-mannose 4,6-dehydratase, partial [Hyphomicrobium sp.]|nr:GDP-mannose 4,6-dehydratase [Hyphomicrobium sp.]
GEVYNFGGKSERYNIDVTRGVLKLTGKTEELIRYVTDRPGHDRRYAVDCSKAESELGWAPTVTFEQGLVWRVPQRLPYRMLKTARAGRSCSRNSSSACRRARCSSSIISTARARPSRRWTSRPRRPTSISCGATISARAASRASTASSLFCPGPRTAMMSKS